MINTNKKLILFAIVGICIISLLGFAYFANRSPQEASSSEEAMEDMSASVSSESPEESSSSKADYNGSTIARVISGLNDIEGIESEDKEQIGEELAQRLPDNWDINTGQLSVVDGSIDEKNGTGGIVIHDASTGYDYFISRFDNKWSFIRSTSLSKGQFNEAANSTSSLGSQFSSSSEQKASSPDPSQHSAHDLSQQDPWAEISNYGKVEFDIYDIFPLVDTGEALKHFEAEDIDTILVGVNKFLEEHSIEAIDEAYIFIEKSSIKKEAKQTACRMMLNHGFGSTVVDCTITNTGIYIDLPSGDSPSASSSAEAETEGSE